MNNSVFKLIIKDRWRNFRDGHRLKTVEVVNVEVLKVDESKVWYGQDVTSLTVTFKNSLGTLETTETCLSKNESLSRLRKLKLNNILD